MRQAERLACALIVVGCRGQAAAPPEGSRCDVHPRDDCFKAVPGGTLRMGAQATDPAAPGHDHAARPEEGPVREVQVAPFWLQENEGRWGDWRRCVEAGACTGGPQGPRPGSGSMEAVAVGLSWKDAEAVCRFLGGRLPTEAEWEFAARGPEGRRFPWGDTPPCGLGSDTDRFVELPRGAWATLPGCEGQAEPATPRGRGPFGHRDLAWGVWEWVADPWLPTDQADRRVQKGGAWSVSEPLELRSAGRVGVPSETRVFDVGFRCAW